MNTQVETANSNETEAKRAPKLPIQKFYVGRDAEGKEVAHKTPEDGVEYTAVRFTAEGHNFQVSVSELEKQITALAVRGLRTFIDIAGGPETNLKDWFEAAAEKVENLKNGVFSDRSGERGFNLDRFVTIVANTPRLSAMIGSNDESLIRERIDAIFAKLTVNEDKMEVIDGKNVLVTAAERTKAAQEKWLSTIRAVPEYAETQLRMFPRKPRAAKSPINLEDMFKV